VGQREQHRETAGWSQRQWGQARIVHRHPLQPIMSRNAIDAHICNYLFLFMF
jgi:hypothetical protein